MAVRPTDVSELSAVDMVAWYTTTLTKHPPFKGHLFGSLQLQGLGGVAFSGGVFCLRMVLLCPSMTLIRLILSKSFLNLWLGGKHFSIRFRNSLPMFVHFY